MAEPNKLNQPILVAVWPGMGNVAISAGYYLMSKLGMHMLSEFDAEEFFDVDQVMIKDGIVHPVKPPQNRFFLWKDPHEQHDVVVFLGDAQPPYGKYAYCKKIVEYACELGVERVFAFAAMATQMHPEHESRVFAVATRKHQLQELIDQHLNILKDGNIGGLNGVLLGAAAELGLPGVCLLGEMPHIFNQLPFPTASLAILRAFSVLVGIEVDFTELAAQARHMDQQLGELLSQAEEKLGTKLTAEESPYSTESYSPEPEEEARISPADQELIDNLFHQAKTNRSKAYELKNELDRLGLFKEYEDRFLDLFSSSE